MWNIDAGRKFDWAILGPALVDPIAVDLAPSGELDRIEPFGRGHIPVEAFDDQSCWESVFSRKGNTVHADGNESGATVVSGCRGKACGEPIDGNSQNLFACGIDAGTIEERPQLDALPNSGADEVVADSIRDARKCDGSLDLFHCKQFLVAERKRRANLPLDFETPRVEVNVRNAEGHIDTEELCVWCDERCESVDLEISYRRQRSRLSGQRAGRRGQRYFRTRSEPRGALGAS